MVIKCVRSFTEAEQDKTLFDRIWASELPGILNRALLGWHQFVINGHAFDYSKDLQAGKTELLVQANPLAAYIEEQCEKDPKASTSITDVYKDFTAWSKDSGYNFTVVRNKLKRQLADLGHTVKMVQGYPVVVGLKLKVKPWSTT